MLLCDGGGVVGAAMGNGMIPLESVWFYKKISLIFICAEIVFPLYLYLKNLKVHGRLSGVAPSLWGVRFCNYLSYLSGNFQGLTNESDNFIDS